VRKRAIVLLIVATAAWAQQHQSPGLEEEGLTAKELRRVQLLVDRLQSDDAFERLDAQRDLAAFGRRVVPVLRAYDPDEPETRIRINGVLELFERVELTARLVADRHAVGAPVVIRLSLVNHSREDYLLPLTQGGSLTPFRIIVAGRGRYLKRSEVKFTPRQQHAVITLAANAFISAEAAIRPEELPRDMKGTITVRVTYSSRLALRLAESRGPGMTVEGDPVHLELAAKPMTVDLRTRTMAQLEHALASPAERARALIEIRFRGDGELLPLLRKYAADPDLRLHAIRRLGAQGDEQDLDLVRRATGDQDAAVRKAATHALGNFKHRKARQRLAYLAKDEELRLIAVRALTKHKSARTIDTFIAVMRYKYREGDWAGVIRKTLRDWTGIDVPNRPSELDAFERWWKANRQEWRKKHERK